ncbi:AMP-binding enzyme family protein (macronuclear) [Tetrahymena thermophila SB210]|uniref:AMP-binding enzyme family protein n=1 Tax=Tetrahymena thermophila (strain SB210) TaxID=312017 RepID=Q234P4_TETTS|nr:AMP-binding enzyme family protein [Tetrahymena thermophila SB210]EAR91959.3 AMP-binding enzyme family protein [Tetrahymena thermophila SB210]|eukprot:XP_001012204.3 AMP-binding enzyme family protein [Tetrahymena thermophila SB210]
MVQFSRNQIESHLYRSQNIISDEIIDITLNSNLVGFRYEYDTNKSIDLLQAQNNKTYIVQIAQFYYADEQNSFQVVLDIVKCTDYNLIGYYCIDFSSIQNQTLTLSTAQNILSYVEINIYGCLDLDIYKTTIPNNCASQSEIDQVINNFNSGVRLKLFTSQFNTTTKQAQVKYRNQLIYTSADQLVQTILKAQKQVTSVKQGFLIQNSIEFSSPIQYNPFQQTYDRQYSITNLNYSGYSYVQIQMDEIMEVIKIQYPTIPQILALGNSILTLLMFVGVLGKVCSANSIKNNFFVLLLQNLFQESYLQILKINKLIQNKQNTFNEEQIKSQRINFTQKVEFHLSEYKEENETIQTNNYRPQMIKTKQFVDSQNLKQDLKNQFAYQNLRISTVNSPIKSLQERLNLSKNLQNFKDIFNQKFSKIIHMNIFKTKCYKKKDYLLSKGLDQYTKKFIEDQINKDLNIFEIYKDIIFLKKAIMILLDKQQLAAIKLVGFSQGFLGIQNHTVNTLQQFQINEKKMSHFEEQFANSISEVLQYQNIQLFLQKCQNQSNINEIDKRILTSFY